MKVWTDERGINVQWDRRHRVPGRGAAAALAGLGFGYALGDAVISNAVNAPGSWLTWQAITFIAGLVTWVAGLFLLAYRIAVPLPKRSRTRLRLGEVYLSELPGVLLVLLAGAEYRRALAGILERRAKRADVVLAPPKPRTTRQDVTEARIMEMRRANYRPAEIAAELGLDAHTIRGIVENRTLASAVSRTTCIRCGAPQPVARGRCSDCYREWRRRNRRA